MFTHCCHCRQCQTLTGSAFVLNTIIETDSIRLASGDLMVTPGPSETGGVHDIYRCTRCLTALWSDYGGRPNYRFVWVGTLDDPGSVWPDAHIFVRSKLPWVVIPPDQPLYDVFYDYDIAWPPAMLARRRAAIGT